MYNLVSKDPSRQNKQTNKPESVLKKANIKGRQKGRGRQINKSEARLVYRSSFRTARARLGDPVWCGEKMNSGWRGAQCLRALAVLLEG